MSGHQTDSTEVITRCLFCIRQSVFQWVVIPPPLIGEAGTFIIIIIIIERLAVPYVHICVYVTLSLFTR